MSQAIEQRFHDVAAAVQKFRNRGGKIVFVRLPHSGELKTLEDRETPRAAVWDRVVKDTAAPGIYYEDFPDLAGFTCPEWSHLSAGDSVEFSKRLSHVFAPRYGCDAILVRICSVVPGLRPSRILLITMRNGACLCTLTDCFLSSQKAMRHQAVRLLSQYINAPSKIELMSIRPEDVKFK